MVPFVPPVFSNKDEHMAPHRQLSVLRSFPPQTAPTQAPGGWRWNPRPPVSPPGHGGGKGLLNRKSWVLNKPPELETAHQWSSQENNSCDQTGGIFLRARLVMTPTSQLPLPSPGPGGALRGSTHTRALVWGRLGLRRPPQTLLERLTLGDRGLFLWPPKGRACGCAMPWAPLSLWPHLITT